MLDDYDDDDDGHHDDDDDDDPRHHSPDDDDDYDDDDDGSRLLWRWRRRACEPDPRNSVSPEVVMAHLNFVGCLASHVFSFARRSVAEQALLKRSTVEGEWELKWWL